jgi:hypothetical protein
MTWWQAHKIEPLPVADKLWEQTHEAATANSISNVQGTEEIKPG